MRDCNPNTLPVTPTPSAASTNPYPALLSAPNGPSVAPADHQSDAKLMSSNAQKQTKAMLWKYCRPYYADFEKFKMQCLNWPTTCAPGDLNPCQVL